jgi:hypothetical protein
MCEGQTEETFIRDVIAPLLIPKKVLLIATFPNHRPGNFKYARVKPEIIKFLKQETNTFITTFCDLYALDNEFPSFSESQKHKDVYDKIAILEQEFKNDIAKENELYAKRFIPYIQPYEFEGLLFTDISKVTEIEIAWNKATKTLQTIRDNAKSPEHINDGYDSKPSERLKKHLSLPKYDKVLHGTLAIEAIGIDKLLTECQHFKQWYNQLLKLGSEHFKQ